MIMYIKCFVVVFAGPSCERRCAVLLLWSCVGHNSTTAPAAAGCEVPIHGHRLSSHGPALHTSRYQHVILVPVSVLSPCHGHELVYNCHTSPVWAPAASVQLKLVTVVMYKLQYRLLRLYSSHKWAVRSSEGPRAGVKWTLFCGLIIKVLCGSSDQTFLWQCPHYHSGGVFNCS